jgi:5-methylcytosine-specific restriction protein A
MKKFKAQWITISTKPREVQGGRINPNKALYQSHKWRKHRKLFLQEFPLCRECQNNGKIVPAVVVDHITPINQGGDKFNYDNLQPLCSSCHNKKSGRERWGKK